MKFGKLTPQASVEYDTWEKIYEHEISASDTKAQLLATFQGADGATSGSADTNQIITFQGTSIIYGTSTVDFFADAQLDTAVKKWGVSSLLLDGIGDYISVAHSSKWEFGTGDFTVDYWEYRTGDDTNEFVFARDDSGGYAGWLFGGVDAATGHLKLAMSSNGSSWDIANDVDMGLYTLNTWTHWAIIRSGTEFGVYKNGTQTAYWTSALAPLASTHELIIGKLATNYYQGSLDEIRITKSNPFGAVPVVGLSDTITTPVGQHTTDDDTMILLHLDGVDGATSTSDDTPIRGKIGNSALWLDGDSGYITLPDSSDWDFGIGNFTLDAWIRLDDTVFNCIVMEGKGLSTAGSLYSGWMFYTEATFLRLAQQFSAGGDNILGVTWTPSMDTWYHVAVVRSGNDLKFYVDGTQQGSTQDVTGANYDRETSDGLQIGLVRVGSGSTYHYLGGNMDGIRVTKGEALWTADFTSPTTVDDYVGTSALTIFGLEGDTDEQYMLDCNFVDKDTVGYYLLRLNGDSGSNYGYQYVQGQDNVIASLRDVLTAIRIGNTSTDGYVANSNLLLHAKSGFVRTTLSTDGFSITGSTVDLLRVAGWSWDNTVDEITSMTISTTADNMAVGSTISLYRRITS